VLPWRALKNWHVRSRLLLLITIPTLVALVLGAVYIVTSVQSEFSYQRIARLANLSSTVTILAANLEAERDQTMEYIGEGPIGRAGTEAGGAAKIGASPNLDLVTGDQVLTNKWVQTIDHQLSEIGASYPVQVQDEAQDIFGLLGDLTSLRHNAVDTQLPGIQVLQSYDAIIGPLLAIDNNIALGTGDSTLTGDVRALNTVSQIAEQVSIQQGALDLALGQGFFAAGVLSDLEGAASEQQAFFSQFEEQATQQQLTLYNDTVAGGLVDQAALYEQSAINAGQTTNNLNPLPFDQDAWDGDIGTGTVGALDQVEQSLVSATVSRVAALRKDAIITAAGVGAAVLVVLLLALLLTTLVGRSMVRPLRRLRTGALEVAGVRLPDTVRRMSEADATGISLDIEPIDVDSTDEIGEVARAFDQVHREALRLAANEAALRGNVNAMFVNLSRRSQSLVERQIRLIDDLEQGEQDPDRLSSLFQMDHLATRMRRNSENLLVLAGHDASRRWNQPVALVDVLRAAVSEIEQYERVTLNVQPGISVRGHAVNDVVHLLAELAENATSFSSAETPVVVAGHLLTSGGVLLDITDQGVGMGAEEMAHANWRLDNPPVVDVAVSRRMGLFVVARLAARHGIRVRLRPGAAGGLTALVWLPDEVVSHQADSAMPGSLRRFDTTGPIAAIQAEPNGDAAASAAELEINAARAPRFASARAEGDERGSLGPRRIPGAGPHPGNAAGGPASTGPMPAIGPDAADDDQRAEQEAETFPAAQAAYQRSDTFGTGPMPVVAASGAAVGFGTADDRAPLGAPPGNDRGTDAAGSDAHGWDGNSATGVILPPAEHVAAENRLPIFEAVESDWFRRGRSGLDGWQGQGAGGGVPEVAWSSPSDQGWEAAAAVSTPSTGGTTNAGLPKRVPQANLVPGAAAQEIVAQVPVRSAAATRERFASFQRGSREGRAAAGGDAERGDGDDLSG
jgi:signal transduction histidine kinase